jgi:hypothetical protein
MAKRVKGAGFWVRVLERYAAVRDTVTMREFAEQEGLSYWTFVEWLYGVRKAAEVVGPSRGRQATADVPLRMVPVHVGGVGGPPSLCPEGVAQHVTMRESAVTASMIEADLACGAKLRFPEGTAPEYVGGVALALMRSMRC